MQRDWIDFASAAGSIATALTLIYLVFKEWKTRKDITDLGVIAKQLQEQNELQKRTMKYEANPKLNFRTQFSTASGGFDYYYLIIENEGNTAYIDDYISIDGMIFDKSVRKELRKGEAPIALKSDYRRPYNGNYTAFTFVLEYHDYYGNDYAATVNGESDGRLKVAVSEKRPRIVRNEQSG